MRKVGEFVLFRRDVCEISNVSENPFNHVMSYTLVPLNDSSLKMNVPVTSEHLRDLMTKDEIENLIQHMENIPVIDVDDKALEAEYKRLLQTETKEALVQIIKTTYLRNQKRLLNNKKISDKDNRYFEMAEKYLYLEVAAALKLSFDDAKAYILEHFL